MRRDGVIRAAIWLSGALLIANAPSNDHVGDQAAERQP